MTTAELIDQHVDIEPNQRDRIADMIDHYVDVCHVNDTRQDVIDELATLAGCWSIAYEITDIASDTTTDNDTTTIANHLAPVLRHLLTTT